MAVKGLQIPLSITAAHFSDVPRGHPAFKYIETLYDYSTQSHEPFFHYEIHKEPGKSPRVLAHSDREVTGASAIEIVSGKKKKKAKGWHDPDANLTRGEAVQLIYQHIAPGK